MQITIWRHSANHVNYYPVCNNRKLCSVLCSWAFPEGDVENYWRVTWCHLKSPKLSSWSSGLTQGLRERLLKTLTSKEDHALLRISRRKSFLSAVQSQDGVDWANWTPCRCAHGPRTLGSGWISPKTSRPRKGPDQDWTKVMADHKTL